MADVTVHRDVVFHRPPDRESPLELDVYEPANGGADRPAVVVYHGGAWIEGEKGQLEALERALAEQGYVCFDANYRLSGEATFPTPVEDAAAAVRYAKANADEYGVDSDRIATTGHSAGAHLAALIAAADGGFDSTDAPVSSTVAAAAPISGVYDLRDREQATANDVERQFLGGGPDEVPERYERASPAAHVDDATPPTLLLHGDDDDLLPADGAREYARTLAAADRPVELGILPGGGHGIVVDPEDWRERGVETVADFLDRRL
ncbi:esterase [Halosimplex carlsbadense 2-9-1]|uniref:Esterase n=1 Tax=Halosimplex carlsbadense 2-9-1 TaxID=797114 RepID=M0CY65_9EURY|nr:alpha/beta hydrolase [Halosimplex carlsbadense]ELZ28160.1 esterase [Halosimplex carlsbadense 2-9-1]